MSSPPLSHIARCTALYFFLFWSVYFWSGHTFTLATYSKEKREDSENISIFTCMKSTHFKVHSSRYLLFFFHVFSFSRDFLLKVCKGEGKNINVCVFFFFLRWRIIDGIFKEKEEKIRTVWLLGCENEKKTWRILWIFSRQYVAVAAVQRKTLNKYLFFWKESPRPDQQL